MKRTLLTILLIALPTLISAQDWDRIKEDRKNYISGEGWGDSIEEAEQNALAALIRQISVVVIQDFEVTNIEKQYNDDIEVQSYLENKIQTYSNATLTNTETMVLSQEPDAHVARWMKRSELEKVFDGRRAKVKEYMVNAEKAEAKGKVDDALRNYYWAYILLTTLPHPSDVKHIDAENNEHTLVSYIPERMNEICESITASVSSRNGDDLNLFFTYEGKPVASLDYTYFDGRRWSNQYSAKDGKGVLELAPGALGETLQLKIEYAYKNEAHIDREIYSVISVIKATPLRKSNITISGKPDQKTEQFAYTEEKKANSIATATLTKLDDESPIRVSMERLLTALRTARYDDIHDMFTRDGLDMYQKLISYGKAKVVGTPSYNIYKNAEKTVVRAIPMSFSFSHGVKKSFVEDIVFSFNEAGQIESLAFGLDHIATQDILTKQDWPEQARIAIIEFLENYKTAFALERLDYIRTIFDDNAVIITGKIATTAPPANSESQVIYTNNQYVISTRYTKEQYLKKLERCFNANEFVNIRFANNDIIRAGQGGELYGIQIKQDYYSTNYGDTGYLFLLVDMNNSKAPMIKVRTWQPEPDPELGLYDMGIF